MEIVSAPTRAMSTNAPAQTMRPPPECEFCMTVLPSCAVLTLESWSQIELEDPASTRALERPGKIELADGESEQIDAQRESGIRYAGATPPQRATACPCCSTPRHHP